MIKIISLLLIAFVGIPAYGQGIPGNQQVRTITGTVTNVDTVGNIITIQTEDLKQIAFVVPNKTSITANARDIGLMDIHVSNPVTIQYYVPSPGKYATISIVNNTNTPMSS